VFCGNPTKSVQVDRLAADLQQEHPTAIEQERFQLDGVVGPERVSPAISGVRGTRSLSHE
jgi:hypothetical protein